MTDAQIIEATVRELADFVSEAARVKILHTRVHRIPMAKPCPYPGIEQKRPQTRTPIRGLFLAGDWVHTNLPASMESAVRSGWLAAEQVWAEVGKPRKLALQVRETEGIAGLIRRIESARRAGKESGRLLSVC